MEFISFFLLQSFFQVWPLNYLLVWRHQSKGWCSKGTWGKRAAQKLAIAAWSWAKSCEWCVSACPDPEINGQRRRLPCMWWREAGGGWSPAAPKLFTAGSTRQRGTSVATDSIKGEENPLEPQLTGSGVKRSQCFCPGCARTHLRHKCM